MTALSLSFEEYTLCEKLCFGYNFPDQTESIRSFKYYSRNYCITCHLIQIWMVHIQFVHSWGCDDIFNVVHTVRCWNSHALRIFVATFGKIPRFFWFFLPLASSSSSPVPSPLPILALLASPVNAKNENKKMKNEQTICRKGFNLVINDSSKAEVFDCCW